MIMRRRLPRRMGARAWHHVSCLLVMVALLGLITAPAAWAAQDAVTFGVDPRYSPRELFERYQPLLDYLQHATGYRFELHLTKTYEEGIRDLGSGVVQLGSYGAVSYIVARERYDGLYPLVRGLGRDRNGRYRGAVVSREDRGIRELKELRGRMFAFGSPFSTQGHLLPRAMLEKAGLTLQDLKETTHLGSHTSVVREVLLGKYDAGGVSDIKGREYEELGLRVVALSDAVPSSPIVATRAADRKMLQAVRQALRSLDPAGRHRTLVGPWDQELAYGVMEAKDADYDGLRELVRRYGLLDLREAGQGQRR